MEAYWENFRTDVTLKIIKDRAGHGLRGREGPRMGSSRGAPLPNQASLADSTELSTRLSTPANRSPFSSDIYRASLFLPISCFPAYQNYSSWHLHGLR